MSIDIAKFLLIFFACITSYALGQMGNKVAVYKTEKMVVDCVEDQWYVTPFKEQDNHTHDL